MQGHWSRSVKCQRLADSDTTYSWNFNFSGCYSPVREISSYGDHVDHVLQLGLFQGLSYIIFDDLRIFFVGRLMWKMEHVLPSGRRLHSEVENHIVIM